MMSFIKCNFVLLNNKHFLCLKKILLGAYLGLLVDLSSLLDLALTSLKMLVLRMIRAVMVTRCRITFMLEEPWVGGKTC